MGKTLIGKMDNRHLPPCPELFRAWHAKRGVVRKGESKKERKWEKLERQRLAVEIEAGFKPLDPDLKSRKALVAARRGLHHLPDHAEDHGAAGLQVAHIAFGLGDIGLDAFQMFEDQLTHSGIISENQERYNPNPD
jgi:hypothetical protein